MPARFTRRMVLAWFAGIVLLWAVVPLRAQESVRATAEEAKFVTIRFTDEGPLPSQLRAEPGQPLVVLVQNSDGVPHCLLFDVSSAGRLPSIAEPDPGDRRPSDCPPLPSVTQAVVTGGPVLSSVDVESLEAALPCGQTVAGLATGFWAYQLPRPVTPAASLTLCFIVAAPGLYPYFDPLDPSRQGLLIVGQPGDVVVQVTPTPTPVLFSTPTPQPPPSPPPGVPSTLPPTGESPSGGWPAPFWLLLGVWALALGALARRL